LRETIEKVINMERFKEVLESWKEFIISDILKRLEKELKVDIEILVDSLR